MLRAIVPWRGRTSVAPSGRFLGVFDQMEKEMQDLFGGSRGDGGGQLAPMDFVPKVDLTEKENEFVVSVDLPGLKPEEVEVGYKGGALWITGERKEEKEEKGEAYHHIERSYGEFRRVLPLPETIKGSDIEAKFTDGVLRVSIPKAEEAATKHIEVKS